MFLSSLSKGWETEDQLKMKKGEVLFQGPTYHKNQQKM